ncbi:MAG: PilW family protein [Gammaproteobacteria bacterium]|nr:PilW family protein [Gammaproteobacteria bacterium]
MNTAYSNSRRSAGFSLIEMLVAMLIGLIIMSGVMQIYVSTRDTQRGSEDQLEMLGNARFAIEAIAYDLRHSNVWGRHNNGALVQCQNTAATSAIPCSGTPMPPATGDCADQEYINIERPVFAGDNSNPYTGTCATESYKAGTDILTVRYADTNRLKTDKLSANVAYLRTSLSGGMLFVSSGSSVPDAPMIPGWKDDTLSSNHLLVSRAYYVSDYSDTPGDGLPSLRRSDLLAGPEMVSDVLLTGVEDFQLEFGVDIGTNGVRGERDGQVDSYVKASSVSNWALDVLAVRIWVLMRSEHTDRSDIGSSQTFTIAGNPVTTPNDGYRRYLVSGVVKLRNTTQKNVSTAGGG